MMKRCRLHLGWLLAVTLPFMGCQLLTKRQTAEELTYQLQLDVVSAGYDGYTNWFHPRAGFVLAEDTTIVLTMQKWLLARSDVFFALFDLKSNDGGKTWTPFRENANTLGRRAEGGT